MKSKEVLLELLEEKQELLVNNKDVTNINQKIWKIGIEDKLIYALVKYWDTNYQYEALKDAISYPEVFLDQLFISQPLLVKPKSLKEKYNIEGWDTINKEAKVILEDTLKQIEERRNEISTNKNCMGRGESLKQIEQEIQDAIQAAYNYQPIESKINEPEQIPDFVKERRAKKNGQSIQISENTNTEDKNSSIDENQVAHRLSILENRIDYLIQLMENSSIVENNKTKSKTELPIDENNNTEDKNSSIDVNFVDYLSLEERPKAKNLSPTNRKQRNMYCPKCLEYIGQGSMYAHKQIIENHTCKA